AISSWSQWRPFGGSGGILAKPEWLRKSYFAFVASVRSSRPATRQKFRSKSISEGLKTRMQRSRIFSSSPPFAVGGLELSSIGAPSPKSQKHSPLFDTVHAVCGFHSRADGPAEWNRAIPKTVIRPGKPVVLARRRK